MATKLSTQPYRGARDFYPEDMQIRNYIFSVWRSVCERFGFEEYDFPILEPLEIFSAKTGAEIVNDQLFSFKDRGDRMLAIRPELTPGTVRMIAQKYSELPKPIKWFMIGNNWRYEKPQTGRGREFYQLEANIFGEEGILADFEIFQLVIAIMKGFGATAEQFELKISDRKLLNALLADTLKLEADQAARVRRIMDKYKKLAPEGFDEELEKIGLTKDQITRVVAFLDASFDNLDKAIPSNILTANKGYQDLVKIFDLLEKAKLMPFCKFDPTIIRGFDYSDGLVYEVFDKNPNNRRSLFGGERFDKLVQIFGNFELPATGFAMGDWTLKEFLKNWKLLPEYKNQTDYFVTVWPSNDNNFYKASSAIAEELRIRGKKVFTWVDANSKLDKQLKFADKKQFNFAIIIGDTELSTNSVTVKNLKEKQQQTLKIEDFLEKI
jgi:histidyl-tRNA synthetase